jgi:hypothetical protein
VVDTVRLFVLSLVGISPWLRDKWGHEALKDLNTGATADSSQLFLFPFLHFYGLERSACFRKVGHLDCLPVSYLDRLFILNDSIWENLT